LIKEGSGRKGIVEDGGSAGARAAKRLILTRKRLAGVVFRNGEGRRG
jgi:hypothetical protein